MKKILSFILAAIFVLSLTVPALGASFDSGVAVLRYQFDRDVGPGTQGYAIDYSYYSPVTESGDTTMYPLIICMAGAGEGEYEGAELQENEFAMWSCDEYQAKFAYSGGAFIMMVRAPEENLLYWNSTTLTPSLKVCIDDFCEKHPNVDTNRIYAMGWCLGAKGVVNLEKKYPGTLAMAVLMVPSFKLSNAEAKALQDTNVWLISSRYDTFSWYSSYGTPNWEQLTKYNSNNKVRLFTTYSKCPAAGLLYNHNVWLDASYDWGDYSDQSVFSKSTVDENGKTVTIDSFISLLSSAGTSEYKTQDNGTSDEGCTCLCHSKAFFNRFRWNIMLKVYVYLGLTDKLTCECGASHINDVICENPEEITTTEPTADEEDTDVTDTTDTTDDTTEATSAADEDETSGTTASIDLDYDDTTAATTDPEDDSTTAAAADESETSTPSTPDDLDYDDTTAATTDPEEDSTTAAVDESETSTPSTPDELDYGG